MRSICANKVQVPANVDPADDAGAGGRLVWWLKADTISSPGDGNPVDTWPDEADDPEDATQAGSKRPTYRANILGPSATLPVVEFDGSDDIMSTSANTKFVITGDYTMIMLLKFNDVTSSQVFYQNNTGSGGSANNILLRGEITAASRIQLVHQRVNNFTEFSDSQGIESVDTQKMSLGWCIIGIRREVATDTHTWFINSEKWEEVDSYGGDPSDGANAFMAIGADVAETVFFDGQMAEIMLFDEALTDREIRDYGKYLNDKWLPASLQLDLYAGRTSFPINPGDVSGITAWFSPESSMEHYDGGTLDEALDGELIDYWHSNVSPDYYVGQSTDSRRPNVRYNFLNGYRVIEFNNGATAGSPGNDWLVTNSGGTDSGPASGATLADFVNSTTLTGFFVIATRLVQGAVTGEGGSSFRFRLKPEAGLGGSSTSTSTHYITWQSEPTSTHDITSRGTNVPISETASPNVPLSWHIIQVRHGDGNIYIKVDEGPEYEGRSDDISTLTGPLYLGNGRTSQNETWAGYMAEVIFYDENLSRTNCAGIRKYLASKYDLY